MIRKLCAVGLVCGPIPLIVGTFLGSSLFRYFMEKHKEKEIKSDKFFLEEKINLGIITNSKLKIIIDKIDSDFIYNDFEKKLFHS